MANEKDLLKLVPNQVGVALTVKELALSCPALREPRLSQVHQILVNLLVKYNITNRLAIAAFIATCGHESADFQIFSENLNYSQEALRKVFPKYFPTDRMAAEYARNAVAIANRVYANRMGNGDEKSGDGWKWRGAGAIQLTGRKNIGTFALSVGLPIDQAAEYLRTPQGGIEGACWFWAVNNLNSLAGNFVALQGLVNVGRANAPESAIHGINDRKQRFLRAKKSLGVV